MMDWLPLSPELLVLIEQFHWVRPLWLWGIPVVCLLAWSIKHQQQADNPWQQYISADLLAPLLSGKVNKPSHGLPVALFFFGLISMLALAGPAWKKLPQAVQKRDNALIILLDLSPSMLSADIKPARLIAARHKIIDLLKKRTEGSTALIAYAGDAHVVSPLTDDNQTIISLVNSLEPGIMPISGSNVEHGFSLALSLFEQSGYKSGNMLLITDGITDKAYQASQKILAGTIYGLSVIGVGTKTGAPIPSARGKFIKDRQGNIVMPVLNRQPLQKLASTVGGYYRDLQLDDSDIDPLALGEIHTSQNNQDKQKLREVEREFDQWQDMGAYLCLPLLLFLLAAFRRGIVLSLFIALPLVILLLQPMNSIAEQPSQEEIARSDSKLPSWDSLWLNKSQRAMKASAQYQSGDYKSALEHFKQDSSANGQYNEANALAKSGDLQKAIKAYEKSLEKMPDFEDAQFNKELVEKLLEQQQNEEQEQQDQDGEPSEDDQQQESSDDSSDNSEGSESDDKQDDSSEQQDSDKQDSEEESESEQEENEESNESDQESESDPEPSEESDPQQAEPEPVKPSTEEEQALEQWLRKVPDDPAALLRNKFEYYYQQEVQKQRRGEGSPHLNDEERW